MRCEDARGCYDACEVLCRSPYDDCMSLEQCSHLCSPKIFCVFRGLRIQTVASASKNRQCNTAQVPQVLCFMSRSRNNVPGRKILVTKSSEEWSQPAAHCSHSFFYMVGEEPLCSFCRLRHDSRMHISKDYQYSSSITAVHSIVVHPYFS